MKPMIHPFTDQFISARLQLAGFHCQSKLGLNNQPYSSPVRSSWFSSDNSWHLLLSSFLSAFDRFIDLWQTPPWKTPSPPLVSFHLPLSPSLVSSPCTNDKAAEHSVFTQLRFLSLISLLVLIFLYLNRWIKERNELPSAQPDGVYFRCN